MKPAVGAAPPPLRPEETPAVARAVPERRNEFGWGRACAREALAKLGVSAAPLPVGPDRAPVWPAGVVGSITHSNAWVAAAVACVDVCAGLGIDVEPEAALPEEEVRAICTEREIARVAGPQIAWLFSAKESVHKCIAPLTGVTLDFLDVSLEFDVGRGAYRVRPETSTARAVPSIASVEGRFAIAGGHVWSAAWIPADRHRV